MDKTIEDLEYELRCKVNTWMDTTFNFILVDVLELVAEKQGTYLGELIKQPSPSDLTGKGGKNKKIVI